MTEPIIERLNEATAEAAEQISRLLPQLTPRADGIDVERLILDRRFCGRRSHARPGHRDQIDAAGDR